VRVYQVKVVSIRLSDSLVTCKRLKIRPKLGFFRAHFTLSMIRMGWPVLKGSKIFSRSENAVTHSVSVTITCSTINIVVRDLGVSRGPRRKARSSSRQVPMPPTSVCTCRTDSGAPFVLFSKPPIQFVILAAAVSIPTTAAETDSGSMAMKYRKGRRYAVDDANLS